MAADQQTTWGDVVQEWRGVWPIYRVWWRMWCSALLGWAPTLWLTRAQQEQLYPLLVAAGWRGIAGKILHEYSAAGADKQ